MGKFVVLAFLAVGCGSAAVPQKVASCAFDFTAPDAHASTCSAATAPVFDVALDVANVGRLATTFADHGYAVTVGENINLAFWGIADLDGHACKQGVIGIDALPPHWVVSIDAQCGATGFSGVAYGDMPATQ